MNLAKLSPIERQRVEDAAKAGHTLKQYRELIHNAPTYFAIAGSYTLFTAMAQDAFDVLYSQAEDVYAEATGTEAKRLAAKMLAVMSKSKGLTSKGIAQLASIQFDDEVKATMIAILKKLLKADLVKFEEGRRLLK